MTETSATSRMTVRQRATPRPHTGAGFLRIVPLTFAAALLTDFLFELHGSDEVGVIGSFHLHGADIATAIGLFALLTSKPGLGRLDAMRLLVLAVVGVVLFSLVRGMIESPFVAGFAFRYRTVTLLLICYGVLCSGEVEPFRNSQSWLVVFVAINVGLFCLRSIFGPTLFQFEDSTVYLNAYANELRAINAETVLIFDLVLIVFFDAAFRQSGRNRNVWIVLGIMTLSVILLSRQRTASVAGAVGLVTWFLSDMQFLRRHFVLVTLTGMLALAAFVIWATGLLPDFIQMLPDEFQSSLQRTGTFTGRQEIWDFALWRFANWDIVRQLFGPPLGEPLNIMTHEGLWKYSLHSQYVATLMNYGISGALVWGLLVVVGVVQAVRQIGRGTTNLAGLSPGVALAWLAVILVYGINYEWADGAAVFLAMALVAWPAPVVTYRRKVTAGGTS